MSRRKQFQDDFKELQKRLECPNYFIKGLKVEDDTLYFDYFVNGNPFKTVSFTLNLTDDYPGGYSMLFSTDSSDAKTLTGSIITICDNIVKEYNAKAGEKPPEILTAKPDEKKPEKKTLKESRDDDEEAWQEEYQTEMSYQEHPDLQLEMKNYFAIFGPDTASARPMPLLEAVDVELKIVYEDFLDDSVCSAWGIDPQLPIICKLTFSSQYFREAVDPPKTEIYQTRQGKKTFKLKYQLEAITKKFVAEKWKKIPKKATPYIVNDKSDLVKDHKKATSWRSDPNSNTVNNNNKPKASSYVASPVDTSFDKNLSQLIDMGFSFEMASNAIQMTSTIEEATNLLLTDPESVLLYNPEESRQVKQQKTDKPKLGTGNVTELFNDPKAALSSDMITKLEIPSDFGFLVMVASYIRARLKNLNDFCVICDQPHVFTAGNMLKPAVCSRELCCFSFQQLGVAGDAADEIATAAEVVDLLICFAVIAAKSPRNDLIFDPYPTVFDPANPKVALFSPNQKNFELLNTVLSRFPSVERMTQAKDFSDMKKQMDAAHKNAYPLLQWIITSNRSHLVKLDTNKSIASMGTSHQYLLLSAPPEKEMRFREYKAKYGSCFAFHGSPIENWHSIMRTGLKNASGTKLQINGAAYGAGIYLSPHAQTSFGYCRMYAYNNQQQQGKNKEGNRFLDSNNIHCIAICEVINSEIRKSGTVWVQPNQDYVVTRFFFVYTSTDPGKAVSCSTENDAFVQEILAAIKHY